MASLDCRICELPLARHVIDYFRWRNEDAHRNALNAHCYWLLRKKGENANDASQALLRLSVAEKNELLFANGVNFNELPNWQKRGSGLYWEEHDKEGFNPMTGEKIVATRRRIKRDLDLPMKDEYSQFIAAIVERQ